MFAQSEDWMQETLREGSGHSLRRLPDGRSFPPLTDSIREAAIRHALTRWPEECCGFVLLHAGELEYLPVPNAHANPLNNFLVSREAISAAMDRGDIVGIHHSHPQASERTGAGLCPSESDFETQKAWQVPFWVTALSPRGTFMDFFGWGDELPVPAIRKRQFRHAVTDCYALVRHLVFRVTGEVLIDAPRALAWWDNPKAVSPIDEGLSRSGWVEIHMGDLAPGDGVLFGIKGDRINHCGVYLGGDLFAHHLYGRLSSVDPLPQWRRFLRKTVRFAPGAR